MSRKNALQQWYIDHGICPVCRRGDAMPGRQLCPKCLEKATLNNIKYRSLERERKYYPRRKEKREARIAAGLCPKCGKTAVKGQLCLECYIKKRRKREQEKVERETRGNPKRIRVESGKCWFCDSPTIEGKKVCQKHYDDIMARFGFSRGGRNHPWSKDETARITAIKGK